jgi:hypothetical protein
MQRPTSMKDKDKTDAELAMGRGQGTFRPSIKRCTFVGCTFTSRLGPTIDGHVKNTKHVTCTIKDCDGQYAMTQKACHLYKIHGITPTTSSGPIPCRFSGCLWSTTSMNQRDRHEKELHNDCDVVGCDYRGSRSQFLQHERMFHDPEDLRRLSPAL